MENKFISNFNSKYNDFYYDDDKIFEMISSIDSYYQFVKMKKIEIDENYTKIDDSNLINELNVNNIPSSEKIDYIDINVNHKVELWKNQGYFFTIFKDPGKEYEHIDLLINLLLYKEENLDVIDIISKIKNENEILEKIKIGELMSEIELDF